MSNSDDELVLCLECQQEIPSSELDEHVEQCEGVTVVRAISIAGHRLERSRRGNKFKLVAVVGILFVIALLIGSYYIVTQTDLMETDDPNKEGNPGFQETEDQLESIIMPTDDDDNTDPDNDQPGGDDDDTTGDDDVPADDDVEPDTNVTEPEVEEVVQVPTADITTTANWYSYDSDGVEIRFFAVRSNDNEIHVAFDACDACYEHKEGYVQDGVKMICNYCGKSFPIKAVGTENKSGGCWPSYLPMTIDGDNVVIKVSDLEENLYMFE